MNREQGDVHNVADAERIASVALGAVLVGLGLKRRDVPGYLSALVGGALIHRGATGHCHVYERLGVSTGDADAVLDAPRRDVTGRAATVNARKAIRVDVSVAMEASRQTLYAFWRDFENLPRFMRHLESVREVSDTRSHWRAEVAPGRSMEWDAEVINDVADTLIAWKTVGRPDVANAGSVHFSDDGVGGTIVRVLMEYEPPGGRAGQLLARLLGDDPAATIRSDLEELRQILEEGARSESTV